MRVLVPAVAVILCGCIEHRGYEPDIEGADPERGRVALAELECGVCHSIPGVPGAYGQVGPPLREYGRNVYVAGKFPNAPDVLIEFIRNPPLLAPETAMPAIPMSEAQARDIAAYLYSAQ